MVNVSDILDYIEFCLLNDRSILEGVDMDVSELLGKTLTKIDHSDEEVIFHTTDGDRYRMFHDQGCCESVRLQDACGNWDDLIGEPILKAFQNSHDASTDEDLSATWTFYQIATVKGWMTLRWLGESNGYYSESVDFIKLTPKSEE